MKKHFESSNVKALDAIKVTTIDSFQVRIVPFLLFHLLNCIYTSCLLTNLVFSVRTKNYGPRFSASIYGPSSKRAGHISKGKNKGR